MLSHDVRYAIRILRRTPVFTIAAVLSLALGIGANTAIFTVVNAVLLRPLPYSEPDRLVGIAQRHVESGSEFATLPDFSDWREHASTLASIGGAWGVVYNLTGIDEPERLSGAVVTGDFFEAFRLDPVVGRRFSATANENPAVVVLSNDLWRRRFGSAPEAVGRMVELNGRRHEVIGVMPAGFSWPNTTELWVPLVPEEGMNRGYHLLQVAGRLRPGATVAAAQAELETIAAASASAYPNTNKDWSVHVSSLLQSTVGSAARSLWILAGAAACLLLIACANVASLLTSRAASRHQEMSVRSALGASRLRLTRQLLTESLVLSAAGGGLGLIVARGAIEPLLALTTLPRATEISLDWRVFAATLFAAILTGFAIGMASAFTASRADMRDALTNRGAARTGWLRPALLVVEVAVTVVLLAGSGLLMRSFYRLQHVDPGFNAERVLTMRFFMPRASYPTERSVQLYQEMIERVKALPGIETAAAVSAFPFAGTTANVVFTIPSRPPTAPGTTLGANFAAATPGYFGALGIGIVAGRDFEAADEANAPFVAVVNQAMAEQFFAGQDPIGQSVRILGPKPRTIVGVVTNIRQRRLDGQPEAEIYVPHAQSPLGGMFLVARTRIAKPESVIASLRADIRALDRNLPIASVRTAEQLLGETLSARRFSLVLLSFFGISALALAVVGLYGALAFAVAQRTREIGIRIAIGASNQDVVRLMIWQGMWPVVLGLALGLIGAAGATRVLASTLFEIRPSDPATLGGVAIVLITAALAAVMIPARRAANVDPVAALQ